ncbi:MAG: hypothetical protein HY957_10060 [Nitrospirae bacterium]|nr:hypothetical protein [Nitrospirota bacterium]
MNEEIFKTILGSVFEQERMSLDGIKNKLNELADVRIAVFAIISKSIEYPKSESNVVGIFYGKGKGIFKKIEQLETEMLCCKEVDFISIQEPPVYFENMILMFKNIYGSEPLFNKSLMELNFWYFHRYIPYDINPVRLIENLPVFLKNFFKWSKSLKFLSYLFLLIVAISLSIIIKSAADFGIPVYTVVFEEFSTWKAVGYVFLIFSYIVYSFVEFFRIIGIPVTQSIIMKIGFMVWVITLVAIIFMMIKARERIKNNLYNALSWMFCSIHSISIVMIITPLIVMLLLPVILVIFLLSEDALKSHTFMVFIRNQLLPKPVIVMENNKEQSLSLLVYKTKEKYYLYKVDEVVAPSDKKSDKNEYCKKYIEPKRQKERSTYEKVIFSLGKKMDFLKEFPVKGNEIFNFISISEFEKKLCGDG